MLPRIMCALVAMLLSAMELNAQQMPRRQVQTEPEYWVGFGYGLQETCAIQDGATNASWQFGYTSQWAASLDKRIGRGTTIGVVMSFASPPLQYSGNGSSLASACSFSCAGNADVTQLLLNLEFSGRAFAGTAFHGVTGFDVGATQFSNFRDASGTRISPAGGSWDPTFGFRFGFGYYLAPWADMAVTEQLATLIHSQPSNAAQTFPPRISTTRVGLRIGL